jgi:Flp pilus assembly protein protease CpaA
MKAILCTRFGGPDDLELAELADPVPGDGEVVVAIKAAALNFFDTLIIAGKYQFKPPFPFSPASEFAGIIESVAAGVSGLAAGDRVLGYGGHGAAREKIAIPAQRVVKIPDNLDFDRAAGITVIYGTTLHALSAALFGTILLGIAITDARHYIIPDEFTWGGLVIGLLLALSGGVHGFLMALLGAAVGFVLLWIVGMAGTWVFKEEAMGGGDVKMMAMVGSFVGWQGVLLTVFAGAALGSLIFIPLSIKKKRLVPFGVFLAVGAAVAFVFGGAIIGWYGHFLKGD